MSGVPSGPPDAFEDDFEADERQCVPFSVEEYMSRPVVSRLADSVARLCSPLL